MQHETRHRFRLRKLGATLLATMLLCIPQSALSSDLLSNENDSFGLDVAQTQSERQLISIIDNGNIISAPNDAEEKSNDGQKSRNPQYALLYPWVVQLIGVVVFFVLQQLELPVPYAALMFVVGMALGIMGLRVFSHESQLYYSIQQWRNIDAQVLLLVFLPGLIFRDAIETNLLTFRKCFMQLLVFAFPMVLVGTVLTAAVVVYVLPQSDYSWNLGLTIGSILASTDPVAVSSVLKKADAPPRLQMHLGGESMLNDGSAIVFYTIFSQQLLAELDLPSGNQVSIGQGIAIFIRMALGGVAVGLLFAIVALL